MDIPFPETTPRFIDSKWFNADTPCDEDVDLTALEQSNQNWFKFISLQLSNIGQQYKVRAQLGKADPEPMEECESEEEEDSVQIVEDSDEVEEEPEPPNMNHDVDLLQIHEDSSHDDDAGNVYTEQDTHKMRDDSDDDLESDNSPPSTENWGDDDHNVCCGATAGNDESDESEESHDEDEEEDLHQTYPPPRNEPPQTMDLTDSSEPNMSDQSSLWP
ncbi:anaphase-promoting complex subunit 15B-like isoform X1 [Cydia pomonella]|uniref:anaphase-promoting complex subunit 15B-like isoform X1 n=1 Tax=Cydia pomonella TaxID=82600 RepID=UPI002ADE03BE|nr:anaphase-promoting complex subunit 15B-like isoform X1 [Cydia pomonella]